MIFRLLFFHNPPCWTHNCWHQSKASCGQTHGGVANSLGSPEFSLLSGKATCVPWEHYSHGLHENSEHTFPFERLLINDFQELPSLSTYCHLFQHAQSKQHVVSPKRTLSLMPYIDTMACAILFDASMSLAAPNRYINEQKKIIKIAQRDYVKTPAHEANIITEKQSSNLRALKPVFLTCV